jgi:hypothetical protein
VGVTTRVKWLLGILAYVALMIFLIVQVSSQDVPEDDSIVMCSPSYPC